MKTAGKWMQLERSILEEGTQALKDKQGYNKGIYSLIIES